MAYTKIEDLPEITELSPTEELIIQTPTGTKRIKANLLKDEELAQKVNELDSSLVDKVSGFTSDTYQAVTGLAYDPTNKKLGLKVGADTVIPFSLNDNLFLVPVQSDGKIEIPKPTGYSNMSCNEFFNTTGTNSVWGFKWSESNPSIATVRHSGNGITSTYSATVTGDKLIISYDESNYGRSFCGYWY